MFLVLWLWESLGSDSKTVHFPDELFLPVFGVHVVMLLIDGCLSCFLPHQFLRTPSSFAFRVVSGPLIFTAISVINALRRSARGSGLFPNVSPLYTVPDLRYQVHTVLQFVPTHVDIRVCNFSQRMERGLILAYSEACRRSHENRNISVQVSSCDSQSRVQVILDMMSWM